MEMVTARPGNVNAWIIMNMHKIAHIMDVSMYMQQNFVFLSTFSPSTGPKTFIYILCWSQTKPK